VAAPIAFFCGATNGYICNRRWTFRAPDTTRGRLLYFAISSVGAATLTLLVAVFVRDAGLDRVEAYLAAIPPITVSTFAANRFWTFPESPRSQSTGPSRPSRA
jgi:putative flippase GtrA